METQFSGTTTLTDCTISGNSTANHAGGGVATLYNGSATLTNCTISGNTAPTGGGLYNNTRHAYADQLHRQRQHRRNPAAA